MPCPFKVGDLVITTNEKAGTAIADLRTHLGKDVPVMVVLTPESPETYLTTCCEVMFPMDKNRYVVDMDWLKLHWRPDATAE